MNGYPFVTDFKRKYAHSESHPLYGDWLPDLEKSAARGDASTALAFTDWLDDNGMHAHAELIRKHHSPEQAKFGGLRINPPGGMWVDAKGQRLETDSHIDQMYPRTNYTVLRIPTERGYIRFGANLPREDSQKLADSVLKESNGMSKRMGD